MKMLRFLASLATDTELMQRFRTSPLETLRKSGLSMEHQEMLLNGNPIALREALAIEQMQSTKSVPLSEVPTRTHAQAEKPEMFPPPSQPDEKPEMFPPPPQTDVMFPPPNTDVMFPPPGPGEKTETFPPKKHSSAHEIDSLEIEPLDVDLDLTQDAILAGLSKNSAIDSDPCGVWSSEGLTVVGTGMRAGLHLTVEAQLTIQQTAKVLYILADPVSEACILMLNPAAQSLSHMYEIGKSRIEIYETIISRVLDELEKSREVCMVVYGHPGVLAYPTWETIRRARSTGKRARMLPAISTEDSLFADLGVDIGRAGLQSFEATRFLFNTYNFDPCVGLLLWQISVLGEVQWNPPHASARSRIEILTRYLEKFYGTEHEIFLYHAPEFPTSRPLIERLRLCELPSAEFLSISTLYLPPIGKPRLNEENIQALAQLELRT
jgi:hypothetical protein